MRPTPPALRHRRWTLPDTVAMLPGRGFASKVLSPAPRRVIARSSWQDGCPVAATDPGPDPAHVLGLRRASPYRRAAGPPLRSRRHRQRLPHDVSHAVPAGTGRDRAVLRPGRAADG
ncbi:hypothetical protein [Nocardioides sp. B-3]|uniref:hypothetical protein n=1 Tax=Nocardioides sp. B-3 TaxID=2895565 RepID=UPI0021525111|nr:hypothetical protein [Nocardioides sp. B-3]UUZ60946.1 hypothetical protein LP418_09750 [Nocardioides sp. B-3]